MLKVKTSASHIKNKNSIFQVYMEREFTDTLKSIVKLRMRLYSILYLEHGYVYVHFFELGTTKIILFVSSDSFNSALTKIKAVFN